MATFLLIVGALVLFPTVLVFDTCVRLAKNYFIARTIGVPMRIIPISPLNPLWVLLDKHVIKYIQLLPFSNNSFTRYNWRGWEVKDRYQSHREMGDVWVLVTPVMNWVYVNDPNAIMSLYKNPESFPRPTFISDILNVFGPNIACEEGPPWKISRRIITRCFNEQNNNLVWAESISQASDMVRYWSSKSSIHNIDLDLRTLSLHVLSRAGFGKSFPFEGHDEKISGTVNAAMDYREALHLILENCVLILGLGPKLLTFLANCGIPIPAKLRIIQQAFVTFQTYLTNLYEEEKKRYAIGKPSDSSLMTLLVRSSYDEAEENSSGLTESQVYGNMFAINFAGHDTVAHTFTFAMYFLSAYPEVQQWLSEEIQAVTNGRQPNEWNYRADFHRLKRCLAVMFETIRLYTPVPSLKWTASKSQPFTVSNRTMILPPRHMVIPSYGSVQTDTKFWGNDSLEWRPQRWIKDNNASAGHEEIDMHIRGAFIGWSEGMRDCPGKKFSQTEFIAALAVIFQNSRVEPVTQPGESMQSARERVKNLIETDSGPVLLLQMLHPGRAPLVVKNVSF